MTLRIWRLLLLWWTIPVFLVVALIMVVVGSTARYPGYPEGAWCERVFIFCMEACEWILDFR